ncbi:MAG: hypothetical protein ACI89L_001303 [Phycisphaerales bacterium]|jgi:hypothetical protein
MAFDPSRDESFSRGLIAGAVASLLVLVVVAALGEVLPTSRVRLMIYLGIGAGGLWGVRATMQGMSGGLCGFKVSAIAWALSIAAMTLGTLALPYFQGEFTLGGFMSEGTDSPEGRLMFAAGVQVIGATLAVCFGSE